MKTIRIHLLAATLASAFLSTAAFAHEADAHAKSSHSVIPKDYPLKKCPVSDDGFDHGKPVKVTHEGRDVYLCCKSCEDFNQEPAKFVKMVKYAAHKK